MGGRDPAERGVDRDRRRVEEYLSNSLLTQVPVALIAIDAEGTVLYWNERAEQLWGLSADLVVGRPLGEFDVLPDDPQVFRQMRDRLARGERWEGEYDARTPAGTVLSLHGVLQVMDETRSGLRGSVGTFIDITERRRLERRLQDLATWDELTGLPNQRAFKAHLEKTLAERTPVSPGMALILLDVDHFKRVNDAFGHEVGDEVLRGVSFLLSAVIRDTDVLGRVSGDKFAVLASPVSGPAEALEVADHLQKVLSVPFATGAQSVSLSASLGVAVADRDSEGPDVWREADLAMYEAKDAGRNRARLFDEALRERRRRNRLLIADLDTALADGDVVTYFQPEVSLSDWKIVGFEALARWRHPDKGLITPDAFIPAAEETGLISKLGEVVLGQACEALAGWPSDGPGRNPSVSINVSPRQITDSDFAGVVHGALEATGVPAERVCIEITESTLAAYDRVVSLFAELREMGVKVALDDFGTGYSSLNRLRYLPLDYLKIDRAFTSGMLDDADSRIIVGTIVNLASSLGLEAIAEGVEQVAQASVLADLGCPLGQGYLWSRPVPRAEATAMALAAPWQRPPAG